MPRPTNDIIISTAKSDDLITQVRSANGVWVILYDNAPCKVVDVTPKGLTRYLPATFTDRGWAHFHCRNLNARFGTDLFTVHQALIVPDAEPDPKALTGVSPEPCPKPRTVRLRRNRA